MITGVELLKELVNSPEGRKYYWLEEILVTFWLLKKEEITEEERELLVKLEFFDKKIDMVHCYDGPHSRPADYFIRHMAKTLLNEK